MSESRGEIGKIYCGGVIKQYHQMFFSTNGWPLGIIGAGFCLIELLWQAIKVTDNINRIILFVITSALYCSAYKFD